MIATPSKRLAETQRLMTRRSTAGDLITTDSSEMFAVQPHYGTERRAFIRLPYKTEAFGLSSDAREGIVRVHNVSRIGLRLDAPCLLAPGAPVSLRFDGVSLDDAPISLQGRVIWTQPKGVWYRTGICIEHPGNESIKAACELFYAAMSELAPRVENSIARISGE